MTGAHPSSLRACLLCGVLAFAAASLPTAADAQLFVPTGKDTLRGLPGVEVIVESPQPELEQAGLTAASIRAGIVRRLTASRIRVFATQATNASLAKAYVYVHLNAAQVPRPGGYAVAVQVQVRQTLRSLVTESSIVDAVTWDAHTVVHATGDGLPAVRVALQQFTDRFVADWMAVHPD